MPSECVSALAIWSRVGVCSRVIWSAMASSVGSEATSENARARRVCEINKKNKKKEAQNPEVFDTMYSRIIPSFESAKDVSRPVKIRVLRICSLVVFGGTEFLLAKRIGKGSSALSCFRTHDQASDLFKYRFAQVCFEPGEIGEKRILNRR